MKVLVTGGAGFIGANFLNLSLEKYPDSEFLNLDALTYAGNLASVQEAKNAPNYRFERVDIRDYALVSKTVEAFAPDLVVHFAAESHVDRSITGARDFIETNVVGTFNMLEACRSCWKDQGGLFHHVSTDEVYGSLGATGLFTETTAYSPNSPYSASKAGSDHLVQAFRSTYGMRTKMTNCSNNYGPYQFPEKLIPLMISNALEGKPLPIYGKGENVRDWLYVGDHCEAIWAVIEKGKEGQTYNIGGNNELTNIDLVKRLCHIVAELTNRPEEEFLNLITYVKDRPGHDLRYAIDASKVERECGWTPSETLDTGIRKTVQWYLDNGPWLDGVRSGAYRQWVDQNYTQR